jgi:hypothetical protein
MTIAEFTAKVAKVRESREIGKAMLADALARGDKRKAARVRLSLIDADAKLARLARGMGGRINEWR